MWYGNDQGLPGISAFFMAWCARPSQHDSIPDKNVGRAIPPPGTRDAVRVPSFVRNNSWSQTNTEHLHGDTAGTTLNTVSVLPLDYNIVRFETYGIK